MDDSHWLWQWWVLFKSQWLLLSLAGSWKAHKGMGAYKRHWALKQILCGTHFASQSGRGERCGCLQNGLKSTTKFPEEKWESLIVPHSQWDHQFLTVIFGLMVDQGFNAAYSMFYMKHWQNNLLSARLQVNVSWWNSDGFITVYHLLNVPLYCHSLYVFMSHL